MREKLTEKEKSYFVDLVSQAIPHLPYPIADPNSVDMYWNDKFNPDNGIMGSFNWVRPHELDLNVDGKSSMELMVSTVAHELHHKWQLSHYKVIYYIMLLPVVRQFLLEKTAKKVELKVDDLIESQKIKFK